MTFASIIIIINSALFNLNDPFLNSFMGKKLNMLEVNILTRVIYRAGFEDVVIFSSGKNEFNLEVKMTPVRRVKDIKVKGIETDEIYNALSIIMGTRLDILDVEEAVDLCKDKLINLGYINANCEVTVEGENIKVKSYGKRAILQQIEILPPLPINDKVVKTVSKYIGKVLSYEVEENIKKEVLKKFLDEGYFSRMLKSVEIASIKDYEKEVAVKFILYIDAGRKYVLAFNLIDNDFFDKEELESIIKNIAERGIFSLENASSEIQKYLKSYGFADCRISLESKFMPHLNEVQASFNVNPGERYSIEKIEISGLKTIDEDELLEFMELKETDILSIFARERGAFSEDLLKKDIKNIEAWANSNGYQDFKVKDYKIKKFGRKVEIYIYVDEGKPSIVGTVAFQNISDYKLENSLREIISTKPQDKLSFKIVQEDVNKIEKYLRDFGYLNAEVFAEIDLIESNLYSVSFIVQNAEKRINLKKVFIYSLKTKDEFLKKIIDFDRGDITEKKIKNIRSKTLETGYFQRVNVGVETGYDRNGFLFVEAIEGRTGLIEANTGFTSAEGAVVRTSFSYGNIYGKAVDIYLRGKFSYWPFQKPIEPGFTSIYADFTTLRRKITRLSDIYFSVAAPNILRTFNYNIQKYETKIGLLQQLSPLILEENIVFERRNLIDWEKISLTPGEAESPEIESGINNSEYLSLLAMIDKRDSDTKPTSQRFAALKIILSPEIFDSNYYSAELVAGFMERGLFWNLFGIKTIGNYGFIYSPSKSKVPIERRFFLGGTGKLRGFEEDSIGLFKPKWGGLSKFLASFEILGPSVKGVFPVIFSDNGSVWDWDTPLYSKDFKTSSGFGIRYESFFGYVSADVAFNMRRRPEEVPYMFHFYIETGKVKI